ncbi:MAG: AMP-binding protein [Oscillochloris sp.]|nr:AMP-binding protein [Oscillochloris sp.]
MNTADHILTQGNDQRLAIIDGNKQYHYGDLSRAVNKLAECLTQSGVRAQQRIGIFGANSAFWIAAYIATLKVGGVAVPFSPSAHPRQLNEMQKLVKCETLCAQSRHLTPATHSVFSSCNLITENVLEDITTANDQTTTTEVCEDQTAALMFTSGTTSRARAVCVTHRNLQANTESIIASLQIQRDDRMMVVLPFYYCFGTSLLHTHLRMGASLVLASNSALPEVVLNEIEAHQCTSLAGVPSVYQMLLRGSTFPRRELATLRNFQQAGGKLQPVLIDELAALRPNGRIFVMYGQTEATARLSCLPAEQLHNKKGSIGRGLPGVELCVLNDAGEPVQPGEVGQIIACGANITAGYLDEPSANADTFADGRLHTGDMATVDSEGYIYIVDRKSDFIKSLGHRVSSCEIESCVMRLPEVVAAAAIGMPDPLMGEAIKVFVTLQPGISMEGKAIIDHCKRNLPRYMAPREVVFLTQMPMNNQGKILKTELRKMA